MVVVVTWVVLKELDEAMAVEEKEADMDDDVDAIDTKRKIFICN